MNPLAINPTHPDSRSEGYTDPGHWKPGALGQEGVRKDIPRVRLPSERPRILMTRTDRIGDVVLSTPAFESVKNRFPQGHVAVLVRPYTRELLEGNPFVDEILTLPRDRSSLGIREILRFSSDIRKKRFDCSVSLFLNATSALIPFLARIPVRIGPATKAAQLFLTHRIPQRRSKSGRHEMEYNLELAAVLGGEWVGESRIHLSPEEEAGIRDLYPFGNGRRWVGIHPGSGGSSRNWRPGMYSRLAESLLAEERVEVAFTGGPDEEPLVDAVRSGVRGRTHKFIGTAGIRRMASFIKQLDLFVGPSTGPMHVATAVGVPVVAIFCPIRVCLPDRWGPIGKKDCALVPEVPRCEGCVFEQCGYFDCMDRITVDRVAGEVRNRLMETRR